MASDHRRVLATALGRIRGKLAYRPVVFELLPGEFTLLQLQRVAEALSGTHLHKQNFRRLVMNANLVEPDSRRPRPTCRAVSIPARSPGRKTYGRVVASDAAGHMRDRHGLTASTWTTAPLPL
jgi:hypothetical protein